MPEAGAHNRCPPPVPTAALLAPRRRWLERAVELASDDAGESLARVAHWLGVLLAQQGESGAALPFLQRSLAIWRDLGNENQVARELNSLGIIYRYLGDLDTARSLLEDSVAIARKLGGSRLPTALTNLGQVESAAGNLSRATEHADTGPRRGPA